jgi:hypothetical protein
MRIPAALCSRIYRGIEMTFDQMIRETMLEMLRHDPEIKKRMTEMIVDVVTDSPDIQQLLGATITEAVEMSVERNASDNKWIGMRDVEKAVESALECYDFDSMLNEWGAVTDHTVERLIDNALDTLSVEISR